MLKIGAILYEGNGYHSSLLAKVIGRIKIPCDKIFAEMKVLKNIIILLSAP